MTFSLSGKASVGDPAKVKMPGDLLGIFTAEDLVENSYITLTVGNHPKLDDRRKVKLMGKEFRRNKDEILQLYFQFFDPHKEVVVLSYQVTAPNGEKGQLYSLQHIRMYRGDSLRTYSEVTNG